MRLLFAQFMIFLHLMASVCSADLIAFTGGDVGVDQVSTNSGLIFDTPGGGPPYQMQSIDFDAATGDLYGIGVDGDGFGRILRWSADGTLQDIFDGPSGINTGADITAFGTVTAVPEPSSVVLVGIVLTGLGFCRARRLHHSLQ